MQETFALDLKDDASSKGRQSVQETRHDLSDLRARISDMLVRL